MRLPRSKKVFEIGAVVVVDIPVKVKAFLESHLFEVAGLAVFEKEFLGVELVDFGGFGNMAAGTDEIEVGEEPEGIDSQGD